ncbi:MAG: arsenate reductase ArsC [Candidatus Sumerlaeaceae bacterium]|nr:arsenate reductase ArsC [Candidatus Sumerlaeaceae bacterium]
MTPSRTHLLFVCVENSNRSQMAEAFARFHGGDVIKAHSAGSRPSGIINPNATTAMAQRGISLKSHHSKGLADLPPLEWDWVITMGCGDSCPNLPARHRADWALPDPRNMDPGDFNQVRDEIERRVVDLLQSIKQETNT